MRALRENLPLRLASLALAVGVWFYVRGEDKPVQIVSVPLELQNLSPDLAIAGDVIESVNVRVRAPEGVLKTMTPERFSARMDLSPLDAGDHLVRIPHELMRVPPGAEVVKISPEYLSVRLEKKLKRSLPVTARVAGDPAEGYELGGTAVRPEQVAVEGPETAVRLAREVLTDTIRIDGRTSPFEALVSLFPDRAGVKVAGWESAMMSVDIRERHVTRTFSGVVVTPAGGDAKVRLRPERVDVTLEGPPEALARIEEGSVTAVVDVGGLAARSGEYRIKPRVVFKPEDLAHRVRVRSLSADEVAVRVLRAGGGS